MKFKHYLSYDNASDIESLFINGDYNLSCIVVDTALENLKTKRKVIPIASIYSKNDDIVFDLVLDREDIKETLNDNLKIMENFEDYERCQKIIDSIEFIKTKTKTKTKK
jgi:hypothetical protein